MQVFLKLFVITIFLCPFSITAQTKPASDAAPAPGTLAYHLATNAVGRAKGFSANYETMLGVTAPNSTNLNRLTNAVWSTNFWLKGVHGLSATPIGFVTPLGGQGLPTLVSPRHYLCATHMHPESCTLAFLDTHNTVFFRKSLKRVDLTNDISVGLLDADLPASVEFLPIVPANLLKYLPTNATSIIQGIGMNQDLRIFSQPMRLADPIFVIWNSAASVPGGLRSDWGVALRGGDSSNPEMLLIGNQLVLISHNFASTGGPNYAKFINAINEKMHALSKEFKLKTDYKLTEFSLSKWPAVN